jgi:hypothetical protein
VSETFARESAALATSSFIQVGESRRIYALFALGISDPIKMSDDANLK